MSRALAAAITTLILEEQQRQSSAFIEGTDINAYLAKLGERAEILADSVGDRCRGFVAYYCNDFATRQAFITLVVVDPRDRGTGLGRALVACVLQIAKQRGFTSCRLEVARRNDVALKMYESQGFHIVEQRPGKWLLETAL